MMPCRTGSAQATFITTGGLYTFKLLVTDWTATQVVDVRRAAPPPTNVADLATRPPVARGAYTPLQILPSGNWRPGWAPKDAWADIEKMVLRFDPYLPEMPNFAAATTNNVVVSYAIRRTPEATYLVTDRRVTEGKLSIDDQEVKITSGLIEEVTAPKPKT